MIGHEGDGVNQLPKLVHGPCHSVEERSFVSIVQENGAPTHTAARQVIERVGILNSESAIVIRGVHLKANYRPPFAVRTRQDLTARRHSLPLAAILHSLTFGQQTTSEQVCDTSEQVCASKYATGRLAVREFGGLMGLA
jgi:hypothetical protein